jgi:branched-chain amino acid transport system permease protein
VIRFLYRAHAAAAGLARNLGPARVPVTLLGAALLAIGSYLPWATFAGFPGKMTLAYPGGVRLYTMALALAALLAFLPFGDRRSSGEWLAMGALGITLYTVVLITNDGGGLVNVGYGAWVALVGAFLLLAGLLAIEEDDDGTKARLPEGPGWLQLLAVIAVLGVALVVVVEALKIEASSQFLSFMALVVVVIGSLWKLGAVDWWRRASERYRTVTISAALISAALFPFTQGGSDYWVRVGASVGVFAAAAIGLNVVVGLAGLLDLGYIAFFGVGAYVGASYSGATGSNAHLHLPFLVVLVLGAIIAAVFGVFLGSPTLRLRGDYLAIVTLGFGEIFRITANNLDGQAGPRITNGPNGIPGVPNLKVFGFDFGDAHTIFGVKLGYFSNYFFAELLLLVAVVVVFLRLNQSRIGRAWVAIREDETAAAAMGVNTVRLKLLAFAIGAFLAGAAGTLNAHLTTQVDPTSYDFNQSILLLAAVVLGGMGTIGGAILGSTLLIVLPEKLRFFADKRILIFGIALVLMMRFRPEGIVANRRRQREFHDDEGGADATSAPPGSPVASA